MDELGKLDATAQAELVRRKEVTARELSSLVGALVPDLADPTTFDRLDQFVAFPGVLADFTGGAAMSVPLYWNADGLPIGSHFLGRLGDEPKLSRLPSQLEVARPWSDRRPPVHA